jgi:hypothetical protein
MTPAPAKYAPHPTNPDLYSTGNFIVRNTRNQRNTGRVYKTHAGASRAATALTDACARGDSYSVVPEYRLRANVRWGAGRTPYLGD